MVLDRDLHVIEPGVGERGQALRRQSHRGRDEVGVEPGLVLLAPERVFKPDPIAVEILKRCTGEATFAAIVDDLAKTYSAPRERILADASALLRSLADKRLLEL